MEEMDPDEYCAMLEAKAREENPEEEYQMDAAYLFGTLRKDLDELERFVYDLISATKQQNSGQQRRNKHKSALSRPPMHLEDCECERESQGNEKTTPVEEARQKVEKVKVVLLNLESELRSFREGDEAQRNVFRKELDAGDVSYVGCLLTALCGTEEQFRRWLTSSIYTFTFFRRKGQR